MRWNRGQLKGYQAWESPISRIGVGSPQEVVREIVDLCGCTAIEMQHQRFDALCCGWAATIPTLYGHGSDNPLGTLLHLLGSLQRRLQEARDTGADVMITSCPACYIFLNLIKELTAARIAVYHPLEIVQLAMDQEAFQQHTKRRSWDILAVASGLMTQWCLSRESRRRFSPQPIDVSHVESLPLALEGDARRLRFFASIYRSVLVQNRLSRLILATAVRYAVSARRSQR